MILIPSIGIDISSTNTQCKVYMLYYKKRKDSIKHLTAQDFSVNYEILKYIIRLRVWASTRCLPTKTQLRLKKIDVNVLCPIYNEDPKFIYHILVSCQFSKACLNVDCIWNVDQQNFMDWLAAIFKNHLEEEINFIVMLLWSLWKNMNDLVWNQRNMKLLRLWSLQNHHLIIGEVLRMKYTKFSWFYDTRRLSWVSEASNWR